MHDIISAHFESMIPSYNEFLDCSQENWFYWKVNCIVKTDSIGRENSVSHKTKKNWRPHVYLNYYLFAENSVEICTHWQKKLIFLAHHLKLMIIKNGNTLLLSNKKRIMKTF